MSNPISVLFEYEVGDFVVRRTPYYQQDSMFTDQTPHAVIARMAVDEGNGVVTQYQVRSAASDIVLTLREFELESWETYAVRHKLREDTPQSQRGPVMRHLQTRDITPPTFSLSAE